MNFISKIVDKLYLKQWSVGVADIRIEDIIRNKKIGKAFTWAPVNNNFQFFADPFIFKLSTGEYSILYEEFDYNKQYGYISQFTLNKKNEVNSTKVQLDTKSHLSYPFIFFENGIMYVFPESCASGKLSCYQYDYNSQTLNFKKDIINLPLLDSTILKYQNKYWIFGSMRGVDSNKKLYIFYSENLFGPYIAHSQNPVKNSLTGSRPAGNFFEVDGNLYRPAQNSDKYYGSSIVINKILNLSEYEFIEEYFMDISPNKNDYFNFGIHTINSIDNKLVIDGLRRKFSPFIQLGTFLKRTLKEDPSIRKI